MLCAAAARRRARPNSRLVSEADSGSAGQGRAGQGPPRAWPPSSQRALRAAQRAARSTVHNRVVPAGGRCRQRGRGGVCQHHHQDSSGASMHAARPPRHQDQGAAGRRALQRAMHPFRIEPCCLPACTCTRAEGGLKPRVQRRRRGDWGRAAANVARFAQSRALRGLGRACNSCRPASGGANEKRQFRGAGSQRWEGQAPGERGRGHACLHQAARGVLRLRLLVI